jgi:hypothetical protein
MMALGNLARSPQKQTAREEGLIKGETLYPEGIPANPAITAVMMMRMMIQIIQEILMEAPPETIGGEGPR